LLDVNFPLGDDAIKVYLHEGMSLLMIAAVNGRADIVKQLMPNTKKFVDQSRQDGWNPLMLAAEMGHVAVIDILLQHGANIDQACLMV